MGNKLKYQVVIIQALNEKVSSEFTNMRSNMKKRDYGSTKIRSDINGIKTIFTHIMSQKHHSYRDDMDSPKSLDHSTAFPSNNKAAPLEGVHYTKLGSMCTLKHDIRSPKFYEIPVKKELKFITSLELNKFYNHIKMCLTSVTRPQEDLIPDY